MGGRFHWPSRSRRGRCHSWCVALVGPSDGPSSARDEIDETNDESEDLSSELEDAESKIESLRKDLRKLRKEQNAYLLTTLGYRVSFWNFPATGFATSGRDAGISRLMGPSSTIRTKAAVSSVS